MQVVAFSAEEAEIIIYVFGRVCSVMLRYMMLCYALLSFAMLWYVVLRYIMLCCTLLCYVVPLLVLL